MNSINKKYLVIGIALLVIAVLAGYLVFLSKAQEGKIAVTVAIVPSDATTTINDEKLKPGTVYLKPGTYTVKVSKPGFTSYSKTAYIGESQDIIAIGLGSKTKEGVEWIKDHQDEYNKIQGLGERRAYELGTYFNKQNPIAAKLPYETFIYTIGYMNDNSDPSGNSIILTIDARDGYRLAALYRIRELGYDPTDFNIVFRNYENPFPL